MIFRRIRRRRSIECNNDVFCDPISDIQPLIAYFKQLETDMEKVDKQLATRKAALGDMGED